MNILQLTVDYPPPLTGGLPRQVHGLSQALASRHIVGVAASGPDRLDGPVRVFGTDPLPGLLPSRDLTHLARVNFGLVKALLKAEGADTWDILHAHDWMVAPAAIIAGEALGIPIVASIHTDAGAIMVGSPEDRLRRLSWEATLVSVSTLLLAVSTPVRDILAVRYPGIDVRYLPNGIDPSHIVPPEGLRNPLRILFVGRLVPYKGCQDAIRAIALLRRTWPGIGLDIVGDGFYRQELESMVKELGLGDAIEFKGWQEDGELAEAYARSTLAVVPSHEEAFGIVAIEAMAAGCPVVATSIPAFASYIRDGQTGLLATPEDPADLARQIDRLLGNPDLRATLARNASQEVVPKHEWGTVAAAAEIAYGHALQE